MFGTTGSDLTAKGQLRVSRLLKVLAEPDAPIEGQLEILLLEALESTGHDAAAVGAIDGAEFVADVSVNAPDLPRGTRIELRAAEGRGISLPFSAAGRRRCLLLWSRSGLTPSSQADRTQLDLVTSVIARVIARKRSDERLRFLAFNDPLTKLPNRVSVRSRLEEALAGAQRRHSRAALLYLDINAFKAINDLHGHATGDAVLREIGNRLRRSVRRGEYAGRLGGDEFAVICPACEKQEEACEAACRIADAIAQPMNIEGRTFELGCSIGIAFAPTNGTLADEILAQADDAMYRAKTCRTAKAVWCCGDREPLQTHELFDRF